MLHSVTMASRCGADMGLCLCFQMSATDIISIISNVMKSLCKNIIDRSQKVSSRLMNLHLLVTNLF